MPGFLSELQLTHLAHAHQPDVRADVDVTLSDRGRHLNRTALAHDSAGSASHFDVARLIVRGLRRDGALANVCVANVRAPASSYSRMGWTIACRGLAVEPFKENWAKQEEHHVSAGEIQHATQAYNPISRKSLMDHRQDDTGIRQPDERPVRRTSSPRATGQKHKQEGVHDAHCDSYCNMKSLSEAIGLENGAYGDVSACYLKKQRKKAAITSY